MIALIDYGAGNLTSVKKAFAAIDEDIVVPGSPAQLNGAAAAVVPGVGHFGATRALDNRWREAIFELIAEGRPLLGICLGMQWLFEGSDEAEGVPGLGLFPGRIIRLEPHRSARCASADREERHDRLKVPHVGWNALTLSASRSIVENVVSGTQAYFTHSYVAPLVADTVAVTTHGVPFTSVVQRGAIAGVQFHPEKSGETGLQILRNFAALAR
jgi:imidazole glycerol-phosphate synthase subunit HisH